MTVACYPLDAVAGSPEYTGRMLRETISALVGGASASRPLGAFSGVRPGTPSSTVALSGFDWTCEPHSGILDVQAAAEAGPYFYAVTADETGTLNAAHASLARTDLLVVTLSDPAESDGSSVPEAEIVYAAGTAGGGTPATPARSMVLARFNVPQSGGGSPTVTWAAPTLFSAGARASVATVAALSTLSAYTNMEATVEATPGAFWKHNGTSWVMHGTAHFATSAARATAIVAPVVGMRTSLADKGRVEEYFTTTLGVAANGWYPVSGLLPAFTVSSGTVQAIPTGAWTAIVAGTWATPDLSMGFTSWGSGALTVAQAGLYEVGVEIGFAAHASGVRMGAQVNKNSATPDTTPVVKVAGVLSRQTSTHASGLITLAAGDVLRVHAFQESGGNLNTLATVDTRFSARYVGPA